MLCEYQTRPDVDLSTVENVQQVRAVWTDDEWELHFVCKVEIEVSETPGEKTVGVESEPMSRKMGTTSQWGNRTMSVRKAVRTRKGTAEIGAIANSE